MKERSDKNVNNKPFVIIEDKLNLVCTSLANGVLNFIYEIDSDTWNSPKIQCFVGELTNDIINNLPTHHDIYVYLGYRIKVFDKSRNLLGVFDQCCPTCTLPN